MTDPTQIISNRLTALEETEGVAILLAVESGSRAWGFPSQDSDYDVRFVYCRRPEDYLSVDLEEQSDVIERPIEDAIDLSGWDIRKALRLFKKSNPPLLEWLQCRMIYHERSAFAHRLREILPVYYSPNASFFHYLHMAQGNLREYLQGDLVWQKKYFYVLRPLLAIRWIKAGLGPVPIEFSRLLEMTIPIGPLRSEINQLLERKKSGAELDYGPRIEEISRFVEAEIVLASAERLEPQDSVLSISNLNSLFRSTLDEVWGT